MVHKKLEGMRFDLKRHCTVFGEIHIGQEQIQSALTKLDQAVAGIEGGVEGHTETARK